MITAACEPIKAAIEEMPAAQLLAAMLTFDGIAPADFFVALFERVIALSVNGPRVFAHRCVNPSLSWTLFFFVRWCIRDVVHLDSRVHAAIKPSHS
jgi:hypothetical protein